MIFGGSNLVLKLGMKNHNRANIPAMTRPTLVNDTKIFIKSPHPTGRANGGAYVLYTWGVLQMGVYG